MEYILNIPLHPFSLYIYLLAKAVIFHLERNLFAPVSSTKGTFGNFPALNIPAI